MLTTRSSPAGVIVYWNGENLGLLRYCGSGFLSGLLTYRGEVFDTDLFGESGEACGMPPHFLERHVVPWCINLTYKQAA